MELSPSLRVGISRQSKQLQSSLQRDANAGFDIDGDVMNGLLRIHPKHNYQYRELFDRLKELQSRRAVAPLPLVRTQLDVKIAEAWAALQSLITIDENEEQLAAFEGPSSLEALNIAYSGIELIRSGHLVRKRVAEFRAKTDASITAEIHYKCLYGPVEDPSCSFGLPPENTRTNLSWQGGAHQLKKSGILGFVYFYMMANEVGEEKQSWSRRVQLSQNSTTRGRKSQPLSYKVAYGHVTKLRTVLRWMFVCDGHDYYDVASLQDFVLSPETWERFLQHCAADGRHREVKTAVHFLEAAEWLWIAINSPMYNFTGLTIELAQKHQFWQWVTHTISLYRSYHRDSVSHHNDYIDDSGIREQSLPDAAEVAAMWEFAQRVYLQRLILLIKRHSKQRDESHNNGPAVEFDASTQKGFKIAKVRPKWRRWIKSVNALPASRSDALIEELITYWQKVFIALLFCGLPACRSSDVENIYYERRMNPVTGEQQTPSLLPKWKHPGTGEVISFPQDEPYLTLRYVSKKVMLPGMPVYCVYGTGFYQVYYWMMEVFAKNHFTTFSNHVVFDSTGKCIDKDVVHAHLKQLYSDAFGRAGRLGKNIARMTPSLLRKAGSTIASEELRNPAAIAACQGHSLAVTQSNYNPATVRKLADDGASLWMSAVIEKHKPKTQVPSERDTTALEHEQHEETSVARRRKRKYLDEHDESGAQDAMGLPTEEPRLPSDAESAHINDNGEHEPVSEPGSEGHYAQDENVSNAEARGGQPDGLDYAGGSDLEVRVAKRQTTVHSLAEEQVSVSPSIAESNKRLKNQRKRARKKLAKLKRQNLVSTK